MILIEKKEVLYMNVLCIGLVDEKRLIALLKQIANESLEFYCISHIEEAKTVIMTHNINLFFCDLAFSEEKVERFIEDVEALQNNSVRGVFVHDKENNPLAIKAINSCVMIDYILRPYDAECVVKTWIYYLENREYRYYFDAV